MKWWWLLMYIFTSFLFVFVKSLWNNKTEFFISLVQSSFIFLLKLTFKDMKCFKLIFLSSWLDEMVWNLKKLWICWYFPTLNILKNCDRFRYKFCSQYCKMIKTNIFYCIVFKIHFFKCICNDEISDITIYKMSSF